MFSSKILEIPPIPPCVVLLVSSSLALSCLNDMTDSNENPLS